ncbi:MAG: hypothetical protein HS126_09805 [Anaerolineales bacterium]|nr:hypothetical protein [Anaerolineales bacterium]
MFTVESAGGKVTTNQDEQYLQILSIFHFIVGGLTALFACFPIFHLAIGLGMLTGGFGPTSPDEPFPVQLFGLMFVIIPAMIILMGWALAVAIVAAGYFLSKRQKYTFCLVVAGVECIFFPFGTVLGVFTIIVLVRPTVKALFEARSPANLAGEVPPS